MTLHVHKLEGCTPTPLAHYLKALGVLRLVSEQADESARGWWQNEVFHLATRLNREQLEQFFLTEYSPTPLITPWNGGSGFYPKDKKAGIEAITQSGANRFANYREAIAQAKQLIGDRDERPAGEDKAAMLRTARQQWTGRLRRWLDAAVVLTGEGEPEYPALLGTGGNDGRLDYTNNFMLWLATLFDCEQPGASPTPQAVATLPPALWSEPALDREDGAIGQFLPGDAGGANSGVGFEGRSGINPWDFVLMLEGAILFVSSVSRRTAATALPKAAAPFAVHSSAAGYASASDAEEAARGEQWMPLWSRPAKADELGHLIAEGRSQVHRRSAERPLDFARAVARLGVARGIDAFQRFGYIQRYGNNNLAVPLNRWTVQYQPETQLLDEISPWVQRLRRAGNSGNAPDSIGRVARLCEEAMLRCCAPRASDAEEGQRWQNLLLALGEAEAQLVRSPQTTATANLRPIPPLSVGWFKAADSQINDVQHRELRLALAIAGQHGIRLDQAGREQTDLADPVRRHWLPLDVPGWRWRSENYSGDRFAIEGTGLANDPAVVCHGRDWQKDAIALVKRRLIEMRQQSGMHHLPLRPVAGTEATLTDLLALLNGEVDPQRVFTLARPLMALDWHALKQHSRTHGPVLDSADETEHDAQADAPPSAEPSQMPVLGLLKLSHHWGQLTLHAGSSPVSVRVDPKIFSRLVAGELAEATRLAKRRLRVDGLTPRVGEALNDPPLAGQITAALAVPLAAGEANRLAWALTSPRKESDHDGRQEAATPSTVDASV